MPEGGGTARSQGRLIGRFIQGDFWLGEIQFCGYIEYGDIKVIDVFRKFATINSIRFIIIENVKLVVDL
jgi:hypothetical protein